VYPITYPGEKVRMLYSVEAIAARVKALGEQIAKEYAGKDLLTVGILKGSFMFMADLVRAIDAPLEVDFLGVSSYGNHTETSGVVKITHDLSCDIEGRHLLLVEDIVDTGLTMRYLLDFLATRHPASMRLCTLLEKPSNARSEIEIAYKGFSIPNEFVVGYGLDYAGRYRNLPWVGVLEFSLTSG